jgi:NADH-quinone oxidoreductase subunit E
MEVSAETVVLDTIFERHHREPGSLTPILQDIQSSMYYLPKETLNAVAEHLDVPLSRVFHVATFFKAFSLEPRGKHHVHVCLGTTCHVRGGPRVLDYLERELGIKEGETTGDRRFSIEVVNCVGACALAPVVEIGEEYFGKMEGHKVSEMLQELD